MRLKFWLGVSLATNVALVVCICIVVTRTPPARPVAGAPAAPPEPRALPPRFGGPLESPIEWHDAMTELRRVGVPGAIIAKVVVERIAQKWTPLTAEFERQYLNDEIDAKRLAELHAQRADEEERELKAALGDGYRTWHRKHVVHNMYLGGHVPSEEQEEPLYAIEIAWRQRVQELEGAKVAGALDQSGFDAAFATGEQDYKLKLATVIGAERVFGAPGPTDHAALVRNDFSRLQLSSAQAEELAEVQRRWSDVRGAMADALAQSQTLDPAYDADLAAIDRGRDEEYRRILGDEAFLTWQRAGDDRHRVLRNNAGAWGFEDEQVGRTYDAIRAYELAVAALEHRALATEQGGQAVDWAAIDETIEAITRQTTAALRATLGEERVVALRRHGIFSPRTAPRRER